MALPSQRLNRLELYRLKWLLGALMAIVSVSSLFNLETGNRLPAIASLVGIIVCMIFPKAYAKAPPLLWKLFALSIIPMVSIDVFSKETVAALMNLNTWLVLYRALNHEKRREEMQLVLLCLFLLMMTGMLTASLVFGFQLLFFSALAIAFLSVATVLENKSERVSGGVRNAEAWEEHEGWLQLARKFRYRNLIMGAAMFSSLLGIAALFFLFIPRVDVKNKVTLFNMKSPSQLTGFSDSVSLGDVTSIKNDNRVALRVDIEGDNVVPATPYWRMLALDSYKNGSFKLSPELKELMSAGISSPYHAVRYWPDRRFSESPSSLDRNRWTFFLEPGVSRYLPTLGSFKQFTFSELNTLRVGPHMHVFSLDETPGKMVSYQLEGVDFTGAIPDVSERRHLDALGVGRRRSSEEVYPDTLLGLPDEPEVRLFFENIVDEISGGEALDAMEFSSRTAEYLEKNHSYSMDIDLPEVEGIEDPVARWLRTGSDGHCEFFASSLVLLARTAGHRARVVVGFKGGAWNVFENYYMVRNADAHAWCEVYDESGRWFRVDPTPGSGLPASPQPTVALDAQIGESSSRAYVDSLRMIWYRRIVNFDEQAQKAAAIQMRAFLAAYAQVAEEWAETAARVVYSWIVAPWSWKKFFSTSVSLLLAVGILLYQRNLALNYRELLMAPFSKGDPIRRKASKLLRRAENREAKENADLVRRGEVIAELQRLRYGRKETWSNPRIVFKEARRWL